MLRRTEQHNSSQTAWPVFSCVREMDVLSQVRDRPARPFRVVVGGIKIKDKLSALKALLPKADTILLGGGIAYTFLAAQGVATGDSPVEPEFIPWAKDVLARYRKHILLPEDHVIAANAEQRDRLQLVHREIPAGFMGLDIGRDTSLTFAHELLQGTGTIFWNGPPARSKSMNVPTGQSTSRRPWHWPIGVAPSRWWEAATPWRQCEKRKYWRRRSAMSTGGGASLKFIGGEELPGIAVLSEQSQ